MLAHMKVALIDEIAYFSPLFIASSDEEPKDGCHAAGSSSILSLEE